MKYKVGQKVKVRSDLVPDKRYGGLTFWRGAMSEELSGKEFTVEGFTSDGNYELDGWAVSEEMIEGEVKSMYIDKEFLRKHDACMVGTRAFMEAYPDGGESVEIIDRCKKEGHGDWSEWLEKAIRKEESAKSYKFKVGEKVVPIKKSIGCPFENEHNWVSAKAKGQYFLFVNDISDEHVYTCGVIRSNGYGNNFAESDLMPYNVSITTTENKSMHAYDLMKLAAENPQKYEGKKYRVAGGADLICNVTGPVKEIKIQYGKFVSNGYLYACYPSTQLEEIIEDKQVSFMEAMNSGKPVTNEKHSIIRCAPEWILAHGQRLSLADINGKWFIEAGE